MKYLKKYSILFLSVFLVLAAYLVTLKPVFIHQNGEWNRVFTHASSVAVVLREAGATWENGAPSVPGLDSPVRWGMTIEVPSSEAIPVLARGEIRYVAFPDGGGVSLRTLLDLAGSVLEEGEWVFADGIALPPDTVLTASPLRIEIRPAVEFLLLENGKTERYSAPGPTVGEALWQAGVTVYAADAVIPSASTKLESIAQNPVVIELIR
jgi:uncharacterized protein YabE (DUF348 family)